MALDVAKFRAEAKAAGYIDSDIDEALGITAAPASAAVPPSPATASANTATAENDATFANQTEEIKKKFDENVKQTTTFPVQVGDFKADVPAVFGTPAGLGLIAAGLYGGYKATESAVKTGKKVYDSLRDKMSSGAQTAPTFAQELATDQAAINQTKTPQTPFTETPKTLEELQAEGKRLDAIHEARVKAAQTNLSAAPTPENPTVPLNTKVGKPPKEMPIIEQGLANKEINAVAEGRKQEALKPVEPPKTAPKAKIPMPEGWGKGMSWLVNQHGVEGAQDFIDRYNNGKPFESHNQMEARRQEVTIRPKFSDIPKSVRKERGITAAIVPPLPPSGGGMAVPPRTGAGGRLNETGRPGEEIIHNLNPLKL